MKNTFKLALSLFPLLSLMSCGPKRFTVTWQNYDETVLETDEKVKKGEMPQYDGATPTKPTDETYVYEFAGWTPELTNVSKDITYIATFTQTRYYHATFVDYDNTELYKVNVLEGNVPEFQGNNPTRDEDDYYSYEFSGWTPALSAMSEDKTYVASYTSTPLPVYHVTFVNYDDSLLYEVDVIKKHAAVYEGTDPTKPEDDEFTYEFDGWDQDLSHILSDLTVKAKYKYKAKEEWGPINW